VLLYQPDKVLQERLPDGDASDLGKFVNAVEKVCTDHYATSNTPESLAMVVAVKPKSKARFWFVSSRDTPDKDFDALRQKLAKIPVPKVVSGPVAFAIRSSIAGGDPKKPCDEVPRRKEWLDAIAKSKVPLVAPDGVLKVIWPD